LPGNLTGKCLTGYPRHPLRPGLGVAVVLIAELARLYDSPEASPWCQLGPARPVPAYLAYIGRYVVPAGGGPSDGYGTLPGGGAVSEPPPSKPDGFGGQLARWRRRAGMTQEELAAASGVSVRSIRYMERGEIARPRRRTQELLAGVLAAGHPGHAARAALAGPGEGAAPVWGAPLVAPRQLPRQATGFAGRRAELHLLDGWLDEALAGQLPGITVQISGTAGVGKTTLAAHWGQHAAARFPDGQLWIDLHGFDCAVALRPAQAIITLLMALGVTPERAPEGLDARVGLYRSLLADKRMLVVLDNARDAGQVRPLLPGSAGCLAVVVTSRSRLLGLAVSAGARLLELDVLSPADAHQLLAGQLGRERVAAGQEAAGELIRLCARLPLALAVTAAQAAARPQAPLSVLAAELAGTGGPLAALETADPATDIRTVFSWSLHRLAPLPARLFRLLGHHPGPDITMPVAAALLDVAPGEASAAVIALLAAALVNEHAPGRFALHDLLRAYAADLAGQETRSQRDAATSRLLDYYLQTAGAAMDMAFPAERHRRPRVPSPAVPPAFTDKAGALAWLAAELPVLVAVTGHAATHGWPDHATRLAATLFRYLDTAGRFPEACTIHTHARQAAQDIGDVTAEASALVSLSLIDGHQSRYQQAERGLQAALTRYQKASDHDGQARALNYLGLVRYQRGDFEQAAGHLHEAARLFRSASELTGEAYALSNLAIIDDRRGHHEQASARLHQALDQFRALGDQHGEAATLHRLGQMALERGDYTKSARHFRRALIYYRSFSDQQGEASALTGLSRSKARQGQHQAAVLCLQQVLARYRKLDDPSGQVEALTALGEACLDAGQPAAARAHYAAALGLAAQTRQTYRQACAHDGMATACEATGDSAGARHHRDTARTLHAMITA
jgi:tetratricopeptide (TPR) repeat protein/transcriptional regulator with XRE-family HTH domain